MTSRPVSVSALRSHLLNFLAKLPGTRTFNLHVAVSANRKPSQSLFPYADTRPKCVVQDVLLLLSEQLTSGLINDTTPLTFVTAIEASVFAFPTSHSTILYISKVDGTGQGQYPSPTSTLVRAFIEFYASPSSPLYSTLKTHHLWVHLFARAQRQYLFPNSADNPVKHPLGDVGLCKWWKKTLNDVAKSVSVVGSELGVNPPFADFLLNHRLFYLLPGQSELEAAYLLREADSQPSQFSSWIYSHPYNVYAQMKIPYVSAASSKLSSDNAMPFSLACLIPHFEDDPKRRFLDELAVTSEDQPIAIPTPKRKRRKTDEGKCANHCASSAGPSEIMDTFTKMVPMKDNERLQTKTDLSNISSELPHPPSIKYIPPSSSPPPLGERPSTPEPSGYQQCDDVSPHTPNLPTFPVSFLSPHTPTGPKMPTGLSQKSPQTPRTPRRPKTDLDTVSIPEFWERMSYRQECSQGAVTGFFTAVFSQQYDVPMDADSTPNNSSEATSIVDGHPTLLIDGTIPHTVIKRIMSSLLTGVEFSNAERSYKGTQVIESAIKGLCEGLGQRNMKPSATAQPLSQDTDETSHSGPLTFDIYHDHIYATLSVSNPPLIRKANTGAGDAVTPGPVNVLGVRRKKKREAE